MLPTTWSEPIPDSSAIVRLTDTGIDRDDLAQAFAQPNETAEAITRLVIVAGRGAGWEREAHPNGTDQKRRTQRSDRDARTNNGRGS
jgi:hypothetical protein